MLVFLETCCWYLKTCSAVYISRIVSANTLNKGPCILFSGPSNHPAGVRWCPCYRTDPMRWATNESISTADQNHGLYRSYYYYYYYYPYLFSSSPLLLSSSAVLTWYDDDDDDNDDDDGSIAGRLWPFPHTSLGLFKNKPRRTNTDHIAYLQGGWYYAPVVMSLNQATPDNGYCSPKSSDATTNFRKCPNSAATASLLAVAVAIVKINLKLSFYAHCVASFPPTPY